MRVRPRSVLAPVFSSVIRKEAKVPRRICLKWASIDQNLDTTRKRSMTAVKNVLSG